MNEQQLWKLPPDLRDHYRRLMQAGIEISSEEIEAAIEGIDGDSGLDPDGDVPEGEPVNECPAHGEHKGDECPACEDGVPEDGEPDSAGEDSEGEPEGENSNEAQENLDIFMVDPAGVAVVESGDGVLLACASFSATVDRDGEVVTVGENSDVPSFATLRLTREQVVQLAADLHDNINNKEQ